MFVHIKNNVEKLIDNLDEMTQEGDYLILAGRTEKGLEIQVRCNDIPDRFGNTVNIIMNYMQEITFNNKGYEHPDLLSKQIVETLQKRLEAYQMQSNNNPMDIECINQNKEETRTMKEHEKNIENYRYK